MTAEHQVRYFEFHDEKSSKFWEVSQTGNFIRVRYGKLGTNGQIQEKALLDEAEANKHVNKIIKAKTGKGYIEKTVMNSSGSVELNGSMDQRIEIYKQGLDPAGLLTGISAHMLLEKSILLGLEAINSIEYDDLDEEKIEQLKRFFDVHRPYAIPKFSPQDKCNSEERKGDLYGGYPFTSDKHPWPLTEESGKPMQPIIQINLKNASELLGLSLGNGLLQAWAKVARNEEQAQQLLAGDTKKLILLRKISFEETKDDLTSDYPIKKPQESDGVKFGEDSGTPIFHDIPNEITTGSTIQWIAMGDMWRHQDELSFESEEGDYYDLKEYVYDELANVVPTPSTAPSLYLGGYGGQSGGIEDPTIYCETTPLLVRANLGGGISFGLRVKFDGDGPVKFMLSIRYFY